ncbi:type III-A CRISPR-associated RAMP protein Csm5 [Staphylococcus simulans]
MGLKTYKIKLTAIGPIHIGSGQTIRKQEYIYDDYQSKVYFIDGLKMTKFLKAKHLLNKFLSYIGQNAHRANLMYFLKNNNVKKEDWVKFTKYSLPVYQGKNVNKLKRVDTFDNKAKPLNDIHTMIRDGNGEVYIPGSSLKGALRTVIQGYNAEVESSIARKAQNRFNLSLSALKNLNDDELVKLFQKIKVSDSTVITSDDIAIYQKVDINKKATSMPLYRECIDVGTEVEFDLTIEDDVITHHQLNEMMISYYKNYWDKWAVGFKNTEAGKELFHLGMYPNEKEAVNNETILFLGGGAGFVSKTLYYQAQSKNTAKQNVFNVLKKRHGKQYGKMRSMPNNVPVALKGTVNTAKKKWYQMGACKIEITAND